MKWLVDTCVWSLALRRRKNALQNAEERRLLSELTAAIQASNATIIGPVRQRILSGIHDRAQLNKTHGLLDPFPDEALRPQDYVEAARLFNLCQDHGVHCGPVDILIFAAAARLGYRILTNDTGLSRCINVLRTEGVALWRSSESTTWQVRRVKPPSRGFAPRFPQRRFGPFPCPGLG
jgi:predicted nucleic acid-binding protein